MSAASNLGYAKIIPNSNINSTFVNSNNSHYPGGFGSNETSNFFGLEGAKSNINAAASTVPGICMSGGSRKYLKQKIKNITKRYKMSKKSIKRKVSGIKRKIKSGLSKTMSKSRSLAKSRSIANNIAKIKGFAGGKKKSKAKQRGGYSQYQNNMPMTQTYSTGGILSANDLGLANPVPYTLLSNDTNNVDNYNHFLGQGFSSRGH